jgi:integrase
MPAHLHVAGSLDHLWALVDAWRDNMAARGLAPQTVAHREDYLIRFFQRTRTSPETLTAADCDRFFAAMPVRSSTRQAYAAALKSALPFWIRRRYIDLEMDPTTEIVAKSVRYPEADFFTHEEARQILLAAARRRNKRRVWGLVLLFETGGRIGSLAAVEPHDVRDDRMHFRVAKFDKPYAVDLSPLGIEAVEALLALWEPEKVTLLGGIAPVTLGNWFREAAREAGMHEGRVNAHLARHTAVTNFYERTLDGLLSAKYANHGDLRLIHRYAGKAKGAMRDPLSRSLTEVDMRLVLGEG